MNSCFLLKIDLSPSPTCIDSCREPEYYDYGHGETQEGYENYGRFFSFADSRFAILLKCVLVKSLFR